MPESLGFSVYLNTFDQQWPILSRWSGKNAPVFLSLILPAESEELPRAEQICHKLANHGFRIIADVSRETCELFSEPDLVALAKRLKLWALRIDCGFAPEEIAAMAEQMPLVLNASTTDPEDARRIFFRGQQVFALHNFYPRPETGLDPNMLRRTTQALQGSGLKVQAFIPGDMDRRGPVFEGLPTLEDHRNVLPSAAFVDLAENYGVDEIFVGDPGISVREQERIALYCREHIISVPAELEPEYAWLYDRDYTCRIDSPDRLVRFEESRTTQKVDVPPAPDHCGKRPRGTLTIDNRDYGVYGGEIQMIRRDLKEDNRVNVIGRVPETAWLLMDAVRGGRKFRLVRI